MKTIVSIAAKGNLTYHWHVVWNLDWIRRWNLNWDCIRSGYLNWVGAIDWHLVNRSELFGRDIDNVLVDDTTRHKRETYLHWHTIWFLNDVRHWLLNRNGVGLWDMYWIWPIDRYMNRNSNMLLNSVGLWYGYLYSDWNSNVFHNFDGVWSWNGDLEMFDRQH